MIALTRLCLFAVVLVLLAASCSEPQGFSGTSTNWFRTCDDSSECDAELSCLCGICTVPCDATTECGDGVCSSPFAAASQCGGMQEESLCLPEGSCGGIELPPDDDQLGAAVEPECDVPGALVCETFDDLLPDEYSTGGENLGDVGRIQDCNVFQGAGALHARAEVDDYVENRIRLPSRVGEGAFHVRFYAYVSSEYPIPNWVILLELWHGETFTPDKIAVSLRKNDVFSLNMGPDESLFLTEEGTVRKDEWMCIELALDVGDVGSAQLSIDGETLIDEGDIDTLPPEAFSVASIQAVPSDDTAGYDVVLDELVIATEPIGCL